MFDDAVERRQNIARTLPEPKLIAFLYARPADGKSARRLLS